MRARSKRESWVTHAPQVDPTVFIFPPEIDRFLKIDSELNLLVAKRIAERASVSTQLRHSTCSIEVNHLALLVKNGIVEKIGTLNRPPECVRFVGNVFLHPEPEKKRWRLIYHPLLYNEVIRLLRLHSVDLPRIRHILKEIVESVLSIKIDLKCAFFQVPVEKGLFCFRYGQDIYTLTRLPMGASTSVRIAQTLSMAVASELGKAVSLEIGGSFSAQAFVDDIFVSVKDCQVAKFLPTALMSAMKRVSAMYKVSFKTFHFMVPSSVLRSGVEIAFQNLVPPSEERRLCIVEPKCCLEVLGVNFSIDDRTLSIKDSFKMKAAQVLSQPLDRVTPHNLWKIVGTCIHVIYALGLDNSRHYGVFRLLSRLAKFLQGSDKQDPRWSVLVDLGDSEVADLKSMVDHVLTFPSVVYDRPQPSGVVAFSDASDLAAGAVIYDEGRIVTICTPWNPHEASLDIIAREALAAWVAVHYATSGNNKRAIPILAVDNTNVFFGIINGMSTIRCANTAIGLIRNRCHVCLMWLPTESMPADAISRLQIPEASVEFSRQICALMDGKWGNYFVVPRFSA